MNCFFSFKQLKLDRYDFVLNKYTFMYILYIKLYMLMLVVPGTI